ncbi:MAG: tetratricopeptide repeat protein [Blastocatellia bacterium]
MMNAQEIEAASETPSLPEPEKTQKDSHEDVTAIVESVKRYDSTSRLAPVVGLVLLVFVTFANSVQGDFVYDDRELIVTNQLAGHWDRATLVRVFAHDSWAAVRPDQAGNSLDSIYYRPIFILFLMIGHAVAGHDPAAWHILVLFLHSAATILVFRVAEKSLVFVSTVVDGDRRLVSALAASIFAIHPAQVESVAWISGLINPLSGILVLAAAYSYLKYRESNRVSLLTGALAFFALAVLAKENSLVVVLMVGAYELVVFNRNEPLRSRVRFSIIRSVPFACVVAVYFALRYSVLRALLGRSRDYDFPDDAMLTLSDNLRTLPALLVGYLKIAFLPMNHSIIYGLSYVKSLSFTSFWLPLVLLAGIVALWVYLSARIPELKLAAIWIAIPLLPHLNTRAFVSDEIMHDRYLYLSLGGVGLMVSILIFNAVRSIRVPSYALAAAAIPVLALLSFATMAQNRVWRTDGDLWRNAVRHAPNSRIVRLAAGAHAEQEQNFDAALEAYESVLAIHPDVVDGLNHAAFVYARQRRWVDATRNFERIVAITPSKAIAHFNLSFAYAVQKRYGDAAREQRLAIDLDPNGPRSVEWRSRLAQLETAMATSPINSNPG